MRRIILILLVASGAQAQWITLHAEDVPRTKDGKLNRVAETPRTPDGQPGFSGLWYPGGERRPCGEKPDECIEQGLGKSIEGGNDLLLRELDIAHGMQGGLPYTPWTVQLEARAAVDAELIDEVCLENEKSLQHMQGLK